PAVGRHGVRAGQWSARDRKRKDDRRIARISAARRGVYTIVLPAVETGLAPSPACRAPNVAVGPRRGKPRLYGKSRQFTVCRFLRRRPHAWLRLDQPA